MPAIEAEMTGNNEYTGSNRAVSDATYTKSIYMSTNSNGLPAEMMEVREASRNPVVYPNGTTRLGFVQDAPPKREESHQTDKSGPRVKSIESRWRAKHTGHIKKPLNAFMLFMKEMRAQVIAECTLKESAAINQILGRKWHALSREDQAKYYDLAKKEKELHQRLYPGWSARDNYATQIRRRNRTSTISASTIGQILNPNGSKTGTGRMGKNITTPFSSAWTNAPNLTHQLMTPTSECGLKKSIELSHGPDRGHPNPTPVSVVSSFAVTQGQPLPPPPPHQQSDSYSLFSVFDRTAHGTPTWSGFSEPMGSGFRIQDPQNPSLSLLPTSPAEQQAVPETGFAMPHIRNFPDDHIVRNSTGFGNSTNEFICGDQDSERNPDFQTAVKVDVRWTEPSLENNDSAPHHHPITMDGSTISACSNAYTSQNCPSIPSTMMDSAALDPGSLQCPCCNPTTHVSTSNIIQNSEVIQYNLMQSNLVQKTPYPNELLHTAGNEYNTSVDSLQPPFTDSYQAPVDREDIPSLTPPNRLEGNFHGNGAEKSSWKSFEADERFEEDAGCRDVFRLSHTISNLHSIPSASPCFSIDRPSSWLP